MKSLYICCAALCLTCSTAASAPMYELVNMGPLPAGASQVSALGMNDVGQVVGSYRYQNSDLRSFIWQNGQYHTITSSAFPSHSGATDVNNQGDVVGWYYPGFGFSQGYHYNQNGVTLFPTTQPTYITAINEQGIVAGGYYGSSFRYLIGSNAATRIEIPLGQLAGPDFTQTIAGAVNNSGTIAGIVESCNSGVIGSCRMSLFTQRADGTISVLVGLTGLQSNILLSTVTGINDSGMIVGYGPGLNYSGIRSFIYQNGNLEYLPDSLLPGIGTGYAFAVNNLSQIVGGGDVTYDSNFVNSSNAWMLQNGEAYDLNSITSGLGGMHLMRASAINEKGEIAGSGYNSLTGQFEPFLLRPVPEPSTLVTVFTSLVLFFRRRRVMRSD